MAVPPPASYSLAKERLAAALVVSTRNWPAASQMVHFDPSAYDVVAVAMKSLR
jgi:hypothetical protein